MLLIKFKKITITCVIDCGFKITTSFSLLRLLKLKIRLWFLYTTPSSCF